MITKIIDWLDKSIGRIKTVGTLVIIILFIVSVSINGCNRKQAEVFVEKITGLNIQNDILSLSNKKLDSALVDEKIWRKVFEQKAESLDRQKTLLLEENQKLRNKLALVPSTLIHITSDSSYKYLQEVAYNYPGELKYPFNEPQVKGIHQSYLENGILTQLVDTLEKQVFNCQEITQNKDSISKSFEKSMNILSEKGMNYEKIVGNYSEKEDLYKKENKKLKRQKIFYKVTTGIAVITALVIAL